MAPSKEAVQELGPRTARDIYREKVAGPMKLSKAIREFASMTQSIIAEAVFENKDCYQGVCFSGYTVDCGPDKFYVNPILSDSLHSYMVSGDSLVLVQRGEGNTLVLEGTHGKKMIFIREDFALDKRDRYFPVYKDGIKPIRFEKKRTGFVQELYLALEYYRGHAKGNCSEWITYFEELKQGLINAAQTINEGPREIIDPDELLHCH